MSRLARLLVVPDGEETIRYVLGEGKYQDRTAFPHPDVLVLDHRMPRLSGLGVLCWLRDESPFVSVPVLIFSLMLLPAEAEAVSRLRGAWCAKPAGGEGTSRMIERGIEQAFAMVGNVERASPGEIGEKTPVALPNRLPAVPVSSSNRPVPT
ncbi:MAG: hypothetical protein U1G07_19685 [Verrucomicrobiota bacterium]